MKKVLPFVLVIFMCVFIVGCGDNTDSVVQTKGVVSDEEYLVGTWDLESGQTDVEEMTLYSDGTCIVEGENGNWSIVDSELKILGPYGGQFWDCDYLVGDYSISEDTLVFKNAIVDGGQSDEDIIFQKRTS